MSVKNNSQWKKQIEETINIINKNSCTSTELINSLLSLIILPIEKAKIAGGKKIFPGTYEKIIKDLDIAPSIFQPISYCSDGNVKFENKSLYSFIRHLRNGIAHQNIEVVYEPNFYIKISNIYRCENCKKCAKKECTSKGLNYSSKGIKTFEIKLNKIQLKQISVYIATKYLNSTK